ncbi:NUDIX domain-containing protein [Caulobacter sp. KR2-114]|uniref:NUDIX domain-containing protein n=1 Tax=Caulobacter sp. KR2-114 TaxID=3400912 RepID=UPI003C119B4F
MPVQTSAALLVHRRRDGVVQFLLGHMGGPFWAHKDAGAWSIPKGLVEPGEALEAAARREFAEELGLAPPPDLAPLSPVTLKGGKTIHAFLGEADLDLSAARFGTFVMEWPPRSGRTAEFPEVDRAAYLPLDEALAKVSPGQRPILQAAAGRLGA